MNHTENLLKKYIQKKKEYDKLGDEVYFLIKNGVSMNEMDHFERKLGYIKDDMNDISSQFIEQFIIKD